MNYYHIMFGTRLLLLSQLTARHWSGECAPLVAGYKSAISLDKLYPKSKLDPLANVEGLFTTTASNSTGTSDDQKFTGFIPINKLQITNISCSKPGGQKVNKSIAHCSQTSIRIAILVLLFSFCWCFFLFASQIGR